MTEVCPHVVGGKATSHNLQGNIKEQEVRKQSKHIGKLLGHRGTLGQLCQLASVQDANAPLLTEISRDRERRREGG